MSAFLDAFGCKAAIPYLNLVSAFDPERTSTVPFACDGFLKCVSLLTQNGTVFFVDLALDFACVCRGRRAYFYLNSF